MTEIHETFLLFDRQMQHSYELRDPKHPSHYIFKENFKVIAEELLTKPADAKFIAWYCTGRHVDGTPIHNCWFANYEAFVPEQEEQEEVYG